MKDGEGLEQSVFSSMYYLFWLAYYLYRCRVPGNQLSRVSVLALQENGSVGLLPCMTQSCKAFAEALESLSQ